ncbi:hypothetical protein KA005_13885 [bacterium]|nr:hypothetical protein [bacterium]
MDKYKTSTFLTGLFCKFRLQDKGIRKIISELYGTLIDSILKETSEKKRILLFKSLIPAIKSTIDYFAHIKKNNLQADKELFPVVVQLVTHCIHVVQKIGIRDDNAARVFDDIMKQVLITEITCDIGECIKFYRKTTQATEKSDILDRLTVLLTDYNVVMHTDLTPADVLEPEENA